MGYAGGSKADPTYRSIGDHMESIQIDFDPQRITFEQLLEHFWRWHNAFARPYSRQYASAVLYADQAQQKAALASQARWEAKRKRKTTTEIAALKKFTVAEDYHQKYRLRQHRSWMAALARIYPADVDQALLDSTVAARLNGYLAGEGSLALLSKELTKMGLTEGEQRRLWDQMKRRRPHEQASCPLPAN